MNPTDRDRWAVEIKTVAVAWGVGFASAAEIDQIGILPATQLAAGRALQSLSCGFEHLLIDYIDLPEISLPQTSLVMGDARSLSIAAASILAKTTRDGHLEDLDRTYPGYHFAKNKGYGTPEHRHAIDRLGPCDQHRKTFSPVRDYYSLFPPEVE
jgi:ribonuclease HII